MMKIIEKMVEQKNGHKSYNYYTHTLLSPVWSLICAKNTTLAKATTTATSS